MSYAFIKNSLGALATTATSFLGMGVARAEEVMSDIPVDQFNLNAEVGDFSASVDATGAAGTCLLNGQSIPCDQLAEQAAGLVGAGIGVFVVMAVIGVLITIFWIWMLVHAIRNNIENKALWIIILVFAGIIGAIIYFFAVKQDFDRKMMSGGGMPPATPGTPAAA